jgi:hypothetical protein
MIKSWENPLTKTFYGADAKATDANTATNSTTAVTTGPAPSKIPSGPAAAAAAGGKVTPTPVTAAAADKVAALLKATPSRIPCAPL